ncbi:Uncharacterised protein [Klebsiella michiganensis]|uniref:Uncharacterized protein n=1 Tax=Klebsiella michiganensis TaxID=1134687 RepID=A0A7H4N113_9ENTR|nr:Uncharacterised protein [Klebsiella michiganensis]
MEPPFTASGAGFGLDALHRVGGIRNMHDAQVDSVVALYLTADPVEIAVHRRIAAPGVKPHRLAAGFLL